MDLQILRISRVGLFSVGCTAPRRQLYCQSIWDFNIWILYQRKQLKFVGGYQNSVCVGKAVARDDETSDFVTNLCQLEGSLHRFELDLTPVLNQSARTRAKREKTNFEGKMWVGISIIFYLRLSLQLPTKESVGFQKLKWVDEKLSKVNKANKFRARIV